MLPTLLAGTRGEPSSPPSHMATGAQFRRPSWPSLCRARTPRPAMAAQHVHERNAHKPTPPLLWPTPRTGRFETLACPHRTAPHRSSPHLTAPHYSSSSQAGRRSRLHTHRPCAWLAAAHAATHRSRGPQPAQRSPLGPRGAPSPRGGRSEAAATLWRPPKVADRRLLDPPGGDGYDVDFKDDKVARHVERAALGASQRATPASLGRHGWLWEALRTPGERPCRSEPKEALRHGRPPRPTLWILRPLHTR